MENELEQIKENKLFLPTTMIDFNVAPNTVRKIIKREWLKNFVLVQELERVKQMNKVKKLEEKQLQSTKNEVTSYTLRKPLTVYGDRRNTCKCWPRVCMANNEGDTEVHWRSEVDVSVLKPFNMKNVWNWSWPCEKIFEGLVFEQDAAKIGPRPRCKESVECRKSF